MASDGIHMIARRFQTPGDAHSNALISNDASGFEEVHDDVAERIDYSRPFFNWPAPSLPENNHYAIEDMALDVLKKTGFTRERNSLKILFDYKRPDNTILADTLYHYLDFTPIDISHPDIAKIMDMATKSGLDPESVKNLKPTPIINELSHVSNNLTEEWQWLVKHAKVYNAFGKRASCYLSKQALSTWSGEWLLELLPSAQKAKPAVNHSADAHSQNHENNSQAQNHQRQSGDEASSLSSLNAQTATMLADTAKPNSAWFNHAFPMGFMHVDHLHESAIISAPLDFHQRLTLLAYEMASKMAKGLTGPEICRFTFNHKNALNINGAAILAMEAADFFAQAVTPALMNKAGAASSITPALATYLKTLNPSLSSFSDAECAWHFYRSIDPVAADLVQDQWVHEKPFRGNEITPKKDVRLALAERLTLAIPSELVIEPSQTDVTLNSPESTAMEQSIQKTRRVLKV